jgi:hypothetical protein
MTESGWTGRRKRRPREHVIADMSVNYLERQVLRRARQLLRVPQPEYGTDALMAHFDPGTREIENGWVEFQVKATDALNFVDGGTIATCVVETAHLRQWYFEVAHPFILVLYDADKHCGYWLDVQAYIDERRTMNDDPTSETITLRIRCGTNLLSRRLTTSDACR